MLIVLWPGPSPNLIAALEKTYSKKTKWCTIKIICFAMIYIFILKLGLSTIVSLQKSVFQGTSMSLIHTKAHLSSTTLLQETLLHSIPYFISSACLNQDGLAFILTLVIGHRWSRGTSKIDTVALLILWPWQNFVQIFLFYFCCTGSRI